jgi:(p)ppGpp synthase/HD superfamily hydrolase
MSNLKRSGFNHVARTDRIPRARSLFRKMFIPPQDRRAFMFLLHARKKQFFFSIVNIRHPKQTAGHDLIAKAYATMRREYGDSRRQSGELEREHPTCVALIAMIIGDVWDANDITALLLHDLIEKFRDKWSVERISREFSPMVGWLVGRLTKPLQRGGLVRDAALEKAYRRQLKRAGKRVIKLKSFDTFHNTITLWGRARERMERKVIDVATNLLPLMREFRIEFADHIDRVLEYILHSINPRNIKNKRTA